jgi:uncharacterized protein
MIFFVAAGGFILHKLGCVFQFGDELRVSTPYRQVCASFERWQGDFAPPPLRDGLRPHLLEALKGYFEVYDISADWAQIKAAPLAGLVTSLAMICPFEPSEKQALLEACDPEQRAQVLIALMRMGACTCTAQARNATH